MDVSSYETDLLGFMIWDFCWLSLREQVKSATFKGIANDSGIELCIIDAAFGVDTCGTGLMSLFDWFALVKSNL